MAMTESKISLVGYAGKAPEMKTVGDHRLAVFSVSTHRLVKGISHSQWHRVECWDAKADFAMKHIAKGGLLKVDGDLIIDTKPHNEHMDIIQTFVTVRASNLLLLDRSTQNEESPEEPITFGEP